MPIAITRAISRSMQDCELTHLQRTPIDIPRAREQHHQYEKALKALGCKVISLPEIPDLPDSVFVEDTAVVLDEVAVITNPGAASRRPEVDSVIEALTPHRKLIHIHAPATLDGGDVLVAGKNIYVGLSGRSNQEAIDQMQTALTEYGYKVIGVAVSGCLHLKSAITKAGSNLLLINPAWVDKNQFSGFDFIEVDETEPYAANGLLVGSTLIYPSEFPKTRERLKSRGITLSLVDADEVAKAEGAVTCCTLIFE